QQDRPAQQATHARSAGGAPGLIRWGLPSWSAPCRGGRTPSRRARTTGRDSHGAIRTARDAGGRRTPPTAGGRSIPAAAQPNATPRDIDGVAIDGRADVFGPVCLLSECLTRTAPHDEVRREQAARSLRAWDDGSSTVDNPDPYESPARSVVSLRACRPEASTTLERLWRRALRLDPNARLSSAAAFRDVLEVVLADELATSGLPRWMRGRR
ncbi:MAG: hypothetical protein ACK5ZZ_09215, partial [Gemmatimonadaceae bacterium]